MNMLKQFDWKNVLQKYYLPNVQEVIASMDKNKSVHKLKDLPHIYWINLDDKD